MRSIYVLHLSLAVWWICGGVGHAQWGVRGYSSDELQTRANLICDGVVISVRDTGSKKNFSYTMIPGSFLEVVMVARIKVLQVFKGKAPAEIEFQYQVTPPGQSPIGPVHLFLEKGKSYHFFLKTGEKAGQYVGALEGEDANDDVVAKEIKTQ